ncbi:MAG: tetratricopeptide repeat protein, partial [Deltaproteobacteria bacterium]|nr:tetratricopeptide repeat protein [Deltaproteobacteria bacterium]
LGLGIGGLLHRLLHRLDQARVLATLLGAFAIATLASFWGAATLVIRFGRDPFGLDTSGSLATSVWLELYRELSYTPVLVLAPSVLAGILFPTACSLYRAAGDDAGRRVGTVGLVNGLGSALGAVSAAWFLVPLAGIQTAFAWLALSCAATAGVSLVVTGKGGRLVRLLWAALPLALVAWVVEVMPERLPRHMLLAVVGPRHQVLHHYEEARTSTVSVIENQINGERQLLINAVNEVTTRLVHDQSFKVLGHLGPLLHPDPRKGVMICLGAGLSAGAALSHPLELLDVVDLSSAVARGARLFAAENNGVLDDPRFRLHIGDGRQFLLNTSERYQVAIVDSTHPKSVDSWILYTREFYELLRDRLSEGGIAVQWLPLHGLSEREFKIVVRTFQGAFPELTLWANVGYETYGQTAYAKLVGVRGGALRVDVDQLRRRLSAPRVRRDLARYGVGSITELLDLFIAGPDAIDAWTDGLPEQTDDHPLVPYTTTYSGGRPMEARWLLALRSPVTPLLTGDGSEDPQLRAELASAYDAQGLVLAGELRRASELRPEGRKLALYREQTDTTLSYYTTLARRYPDDPNKLFEAATQLSNLGHPREGRDLFRTALRLSPDDLRLRLNYALSLLQLGATEQAIAVLARLRRERPGSPLVLRNLGMATLEAGDPGVAVHHLEEALAIDPESISARLALGRAWTALGELNRAEGALTEVVKRNEWVAEAHHRLGLIAARREDHDRAAEYHRRACDLEPYLPTYPYHRAVALQAAGKPNQAVDSYRATLALEPNHALALNGLGLVHAAEGRLEQAAVFHLQALDVDPGFAGAAHNLGLARRRQGQKTEAIAAFCRALALQPTLGPARRQLAELGARPASCAD